MISVIIVITNLSVKLRKMANDKLMFFSKVQNCLSRNKSFLTIKVALLRIPNPDSIGVNRTP